MNERERRLALGTRLVSQVLAPMKQAFVGKDEIVDLLGICLVGGENLFLLGPPGTAKSALVLDLGRRLEGRTFDYLLTRFTEPSELFGPFDIRRLREGELVTNTEGMLPEAALVFLDELLNANSAILNSLLGVLNERVFRRGKETRAVPLVMAVGASNHLPEDESLGALFDRFLMRVRCANVPEERLGEVLDAGWKLEHGRTAAAAPLSIADVKELAQLLPEVELAGVRAGYVELVKRLRAAGIHVSDRRAVKVQRLVAASALLCGRLVADLSDLWVFRHVWDTEEQDEILAAIVEETTARSSSPAAHPRARTNAPPDPERLASDVEDLERRLAQAGITEQALAELRDHLGILAARCQWVQGEEQRDYLARKVEALWTKVGNGA